MSNLACSACGREILAVTAEITGGYCRPCHKKVLLQARKKVARVIEPVEQPPISFEGACAEARRLMPDAWLWSVIDDNSPFGNDTGADTAAFFVDWRRAFPRTHPCDFLKALFERWAIERTLDLELSEEDLSKQLPVRHFHILTGDDAVIATAFAQLALEGRVAARLLRAAEIALSRQMLSSVIAFRGWVNPSERSLRLAYMSEVLRAATAES